MGWPVPPLCRKDDPGSLDRIVSELGQGNPRIGTNFRSQISDLRKPRYKIQDPKSKKRIIHYRVHRFSMGEKLALGLKF
jgi:hypothetical protein